MCNTCNKPSNVICGCKPKGCAVRDLSTDCSTYYGITLPCTGVETGTPLTEVIQSLDAKICTMSGGTELVSVGIGTPVYIGQNTLQQHQIRSIISASSNLLVEVKDETITLTVAAGNSYSAGTGLLLNNFVFSANPAYIAPAVQTALDTKQATLVSGTNIKTVGGQSLLGSGNVTEVQNSLTASTILAPSVTAVQTGLDGKLSLTGGTMSGDIFSTSIIPIDFNRTLGNISSWFGRAYVSKAYTQQFLPLTANLDLITTNYTGLTTWSTYYRATGNFNVGADGTDSGFKLNVEGTGNFEDTMTTQGDIESTTATKGLVLKSPNGNRWRVTVSNAGVLSAPTLI